MPALSCGTNYPVTKPSNPCRVVGWPPAPDIKTFKCGPNNELVCLTQADTLRLAQFIHDVTEVRRDLARCPLVVFDAE